MAIEIEKNNNKKLLSKKNALYAVGFAEMQIPWQARPLNEVLFIIYK